MSGSFTCDSKLFQPSRSAFGVDVILRFFVASTAIERTICSARMCFFSTSETIAKTPYSLNVVLAPRCTSSTNNLGAKDRNRPG